MIPTSSKIRPLHVVLILLSMLVVNMISARYFSSSQAKAQDIRAEMKAFIEENPEVLVHALETYYSKSADRTLKQQADTIKKEKTLLWSQAHNPILGNPKGTHRIVEFFDYNCGYCKQVDRVLMGLVKEDPELLVLLRPYPVLSDFSKELTETMLTIFDRLGQEAFEAMHQSLMTNQPFPVRNSAELLKMLAHHHIEQAPLLKAARDPITLNTMEATRQLAEKLLLQGVPSFVVGETVYPGMVDKATFQKALNSTSPKE